MPAKIFRQIRKQHVLSAIQEIDSKGVRAGRDSTTYVLIYQDKTYPPKLVLSLAARYATGKELEPFEFKGGLETDTFKHFKSLGFTIIPKNDPLLNQDWSKEEVTLIVGDYFAMLQLELRGQKFSKADHRRDLLPRLDNRTAGSVEFKHQNTSAILAKMG
jgi:hypothetical protein